MQDVPAVEAGSFAVERQFGCGAGLAQVNGRRGRDDFENGSSRIARPQGKVLVVVRFTPVADQGQYPAAVGVERSKTP